MKVWRAKSSPAGFWEDNANKSLIVGIGPILSDSTRIGESNQ